MVCLLKEPAEVVCELTDLHPSDVTKILRGLVDQGFLVTEGAGRGTVYRFAGVNVVTPEDVFDTTFDHLTGSSVNLSASSGNLTKLAELTDGQRDESGRLLSAHHHLPFPDSLEVLCKRESQRLEEIAREPRAEGKVDREILKVAILELCTGQCVTLNSLSSLVNRSKSTLRTQYLTQMCKDQELRMAFPDKPNNFRQAYTKA